MNPDAIDPTAPRAGLITGGRAWRLLLALVFFALGGALSVVLGHRFTTSAVVDIGPTDAGYVRDFREIERDGPVYFRWTSVPSSTLSLPVRFCGPGSIRMRVRRHFVDPAVLTVSIGGRVLGQRAVQARSDHPYEIIEFKVPEIICTSNVLVLLESSVENDRPIGVAIDWVELRGSGGFRPAPDTVLRGSAALALTAIAIWLAGGSLSIALGVNGVMAALIGFGLAAAPVPLERVLRGGVAALGLSLALGLLLARLSGIFALSARARTSLVAITIATMVSRAIFLHPQAFYPDYRVHALVQQTLNSSGLSGFLDRLFEMQYARSLGLQQIGGNWYPFPYPPGSYVLAGGVLQLFGLDSLGATMVTAITAASLIPLLTVAVGVALGVGESACIAGAFFVALQPLLVRRMALGYFPGLCGQLADAVSMLLILRVLRSSASPRLRVGWLVASLLAAFLIYTQSIANFGLLVGALMIVELLRRSLGGRAGAMRVALAAALALSASVGIFYWRYLPVMENIANRRPQPESVVLDRLEQLRLGAAARPVTPEADDLDDPYSGSTIDPIRGLARLGSRLWRFNGPFSLAVLAGGWFMLRRSTRADQNLILAWIAVPIGISLLAAGLPTPNGFQHLKDLEFVGPLMALALGVLFRRLWERHPVMGAVLVGAWAIFAANSFAVEFTERLMPLAGF